VSKKIIEFSAKLNTDNFEKKISELNKKLETMTNPYSSMKTTNAVRERMQSMGLIAPNSQDESRMRQQETLRKRTVSELEREAQKQYRDLERISKLEDGRKKKLEEIKKIKTDTFNDEIAKSRQIEAQEKRLLEVTQKRAALQQGILNTTDQISQINEGKRKMGLFSGGDHTYSVPGTGGLLRLGGMAGMLGVAGATIAGLSATAAGATRFIAQRPIDRALAEAQLAQGTMNISGASSLFQGNLTDFMYANPERQKAIGRVEQFSKLMDTQRAGGARDLSRRSPLELSPQQAIESLGGGPNPFYDAFRAPSGARFESFLDSLGLASETQKEHLKTFEDKRRVDMIIQQTEAEKQKDPFKWQTREAFSAQRAQHFELQKRLGMSDDFLEQSFLMKNTNLGLTREEIMSGAQGIMGAGGSTRASRDLAGLAAQAQRSGITSASQVIGRLSGLSGDATLTENNFKRMMGESVKLGLDTSEFRLENNKFQEVLAATIATTGMGGADTAARISSTFGQFLSDKSMVGIEGAKSAFDLFNQMTAGNEGVGAQVRGAMILSKHNYLDSGSKITLQSMSLNDMTEDNPVMHHMYEQAKASGFEGSLSEYISQLRKDKASSFTTRADTDKLIEKFQSKSEITESDRGELTTQLRQDLGERLDRLGVSGQRSLVSYFEKGGDMSGVQDEIDRISGSLGAEAINKGTPSTAQSELEVLARSQTFVTGQFSQMRVQIDELSESLKKVDFAEFIKMLEAQARISQGQMGAKQTIPTGGKSQ
jgi:hypothetical protein